MFRPGPSQSGGLLFYLLLQWKSKASSREDPSFSSVETGFAIRPLSAQMARRSLARCFSYQLSLSHEALLDWVVRLLLGSSHLKRVDRINRRILIAGEDQELNLDAMERSSSST